jgi:hypothetical protein
MVLFGDWTRGAKVVGTTRWGVALAAIFVTLVLLGANQLQLTEAAPLYPVCAGDLRHLSWVWHFPVDGSKEAIAQKLSASRMGVILKSHDGTDWMANHDHSPTLSVPRRWANWPTSSSPRRRSLPMPSSRPGPDNRGHMAAQVLNSGARGIIFDLEPWAGYWRGSPHSAQVFGQELRRLAPQGVVITAVEPRPWVLPNVPVAEFAAFSDALATMDYWETYRSNGPLFAAWGYPPGPEGITPEFLIDVEQRPTATTCRYCRLGRGRPKIWVPGPIRPIRGSRRMSRLCVGHGVTLSAGFDLLRDRFPGAGRRFVARRRSPHS